MDVNMFDSGEKPEKKAALWFESLLKQEAVRQPAGNKQLHTTAINGPI